MLAFSPVPVEGAGCRFRIAQYIPSLEARGFQVTVRPFYTREFFRLVYQPGRYGQKTAFMARQLLDRLISLSTRRQYDIVFLYREMFPVGPPLLEWAFSRPGGPAIVYDFDDAIFLPNTSETNRIVSFLKYPQKVATIIKRSDQVIAGNTYLADYARAHNDAVTVIPTCVDTTKLVPTQTPVDRAARPIIGWIGSPTTAPYLLGLADVLRRVAGAHPSVLRVSGAGRDVEMPGVDVSNLPWSLEQEVSLFNGCDIGVYPMPDDEWTKGKCGFKAIQFMSCGVPVVASAVGVNREIIEDGVNGYLASTEDEWVEKIGRLATDPGLRRRVGLAGRATVEERYSLRVNAPKMTETLLQAIDRGRG